ncbi:hypothetical protein PVAP13_5NG256681 [Panicum virgatum]|uniref:Zinc finger GRF-type domain-containing protein n=1 Tax=Panicum virgatum TaxID=38727 RepID=A0A8T0RXK5_PANVG|nr:hypothetical protein PVAP13_5NG256681 [Panicum virgatum]
MGGLYAVRRLGRQVDGLFIGWWQGHASPRVLSKVKLQVIGGIANNEKNRGEAYYMCPNYNGRHGICKWFLWKEQYMTYLSELQSQIQMGGAQVTANTRTEMEEDKIKELCVVLVKLVGVLQRLNMLLTGVIVLIMAPFVVRNFKGGKVSL